MSLLTYFIGVFMGVLIGIRNTPSLPKDAIIMKRDSKGRFVKR